MARIKELAIRMAKENPTWGYTRIVGALANIGHDVARTTVAKILKAAGIAPAPGTRTTDLVANVPEGTRWRDRRRRLLHR